MLYLKTKLLASKLVERKQTEKTDAARICIALEREWGGGENSLRGKVQRAGNPKHCKKIHCQGEEEDGVGRVVEVGRVRRHIAPAGPATHCHTLHTTPTNN